MYFENNNNKSYKAKVALEHKNTTTNKSEKLYLINGAKR